MSDFTSTQDQSSSQIRAKVFFVTNAISHYRERFLNLLRDRLKQEGIELEVVYGKDYQGHNIGGNIPWATALPLVSFRSFTWLSVPKPTKQADLVIISQVLKHLWIYPLLLRHVLGTQKIALWGHGKVFSAMPENRLATFVKHFVSKRCDWWFAYTEKSARVVRDEIGYPAERITVVNNAVDTTALAAAKARLTSDEIDALRNSLGTASPNVGIFVGGMYHSRHHTKRLTFLVDACLEIRKSIPDFEMVFIGGGPDQGVVEAAAAKYPWMHYLGIKKGTEAVPYWAISKVCLNPGLVGLSILDCLALGVPMVTSKVPYHSPEIDYLVPEVNGLMIEDHNDPIRYAAAAITLMKDDRKRESFAKNGREMAGRITNEAMVENFTKGIVKCLDLPNLRPNLNLIES
jgi:glycosyltransferase involved in cell wall biosynthesis